MSPLTAEELATLEELEQDVAKPVEPVKGEVRVDRFVGDPVGMDDAGELFPIPPPDEAEPKPG